MPIITQIRKMTEQTKQVKLVSNTRIYLDARKLLDEILDITPNFPRAYKFSVGAKMQDLGISLLREIAAAYMNKDSDIRLRHLTEFQTLFETLKTLIRIAGERRWIKGLGRHAQIVELMDAIGKQSSAWKNSLTKIKE